MKKNILAIIILLAGVGCVIAGLSLSNIDKTNEKRPSTEVKEESNPDTTKNPNEKLKNEKCLQNLCITDLEIAKQVEIYSITATIQNKGELITEQAFALIFTTKDGSEVRKVHYISKLEKNETIPLEIQFIVTDKELMEASDYKIEKATTAEYNQIVSNIVN